MALREDGCPKVWVVTSDLAQQHAAYGAVSILVYIISKQEWKFEKIESL